MHGDVKDQVDCTHAVQKPKNVRPGASSGNNLKGANILLNELLQRLSRVEELYFDKCMGAKSELGAEFFLGLAEAW